MNLLTKERQKFAKAAQDSGVHSDLSGTEDMRTASIDAFGIEIPVRLQGEHTIAGAHGATETYQEETCTVIVFPHGAVLRTSTNLSAGQHLLLKNQKTNQEVPCRVTNLRSYSTGFVEIEFIHPAPGFWGIIFPSEAPKLPKQPATPSAVPATTPAIKTYSPLPSPAYSKEVIPRGSFPRASTSTPERPPAAPPSAQVSSFTAPSSHERETQSLADSVAIKPPAEKASTRSDRAAETAALPSSFGAHEEKEHWATLSYGRFSSFEVHGAKEDTQDDFSLGAPSPVRERKPRWKPILIGAAVIALGLALGMGAGFLRRHFTKTAVTVASLSPATTPAPEQAPEQKLDQANPAVQPQAVAGPSAESVEIPLQPPSSANPSSQPDKPTPAETAEVVVSHPKNKAPATTEVAASHAKNKAPAASEPGPKPSFKLTPHAAAPRRASVSRETPAPPALPALGDAVAASPAGPGISNGVMPDALRGDAEVPPPPEPAKTPEKIGGDVKLPRLLHMVPPSYPPSAKQTNVEGEVTIQASIDTAGKVTDAKVISGPMLLRQAAMDAVRRWKYEPATLDGKPVPMQVVVKVKFRLN